MDLLGAEARRVIIETLNGMVAADPGALLALLETRVPCNDAMRDHPTVQVGRDDNGQAVVGMLGILNGLVGTIPDGPREGWGFIGARFEVDCPNGHETARGSRVGDPCPECDASLVLGALYGFVDTSRTDEQEG